MCYNLRYDPDLNVGWIDLRDFNEWCALPESAEMLMMFNPDEVLAANGEGNCKLPRERGS